MVGSSFGGLCLRRATTASTIASGINTAIPLSRNTAAAIGPSQARCQGCLSSAHSTTTVNRMSSVNSASVSAVRPEWAKTKPKVVASTSPRKERDRRLRTRAAPNLEGRQSSATPR